MIIGLVQINNSFSGQNYLPYAVACLQSYVVENAKKGSQVEFLSPIYKRMPINIIVDRLCGANLVGFSTYVWNAEISLEIARRLRTVSPQTLIVFGGPQVPDQPENFLRKHDFIDLVVHNEGEQTFANIVDNYDNQRWNELTGISFIDNDDNLHTSPPTLRLRDLSVVPSPFLNGSFDRLMDEEPDENWIGLWETNRGCPFSCTFCDWGSATAAKVNKFDDDRLEQELNWMAGNKIEFIFVCDANFGIQKRDVQIAEAVARVKEKTGYPIGFSVQNTKNATDRAYLTQKIIADSGLNKGVALSMQSLDQTTLKNIKRDNISLDTYFELSKRFAADNVETYSDLILPLPGETYSSFIRGVSALVAAGQHNRIQFNNLSILPNAEMGDPEYIKKFGMKIVKSEIVNIHGRRELNNDDVPEYQELVTATNSMPAADWRKARAFSWMASFLYFDKIFQIPIMISLINNDIDFHTIIEGFLCADKEKFPIVDMLNTFFIGQAISIENGGLEYVFSEEWLEIFWPADEHAFIKLTLDGRMAAFYQEAEIILKELLCSEGYKIDHEILSEAVILNRELLSRPYDEQQLTLENNYNLLDVYKGMRWGKVKEIKKQRGKITIDRSKMKFSDEQEWCRQVVWWGNKKGAYLTDAFEQTIVPEIAGIY